MLNKAVFLDRDGTIIEECEYLKDKEKVKILPKVIQSLKILRKENFKIIIISNQSGIGRGYFTEKEVEEINQKMLNLFKKKGTHIDKIYFCPHKPEDNCACRKPKIGMLKKAKKEIGIDLKKSYFIGDKVIDVETGINAGIKTILVLTGYGKESCLKIKPDYVAKNLLEAAKWIIGDIYEKKY